MRRVKTFEQYISENNLNEAIDPVTLLFAAGFVGYTFGKDILDAYKQRKILNSEASVIRNEIEKLDLKKRKARKQGKDFKVDKIQDKIDMYQQKLDYINNQKRLHIERIKDYEGNSKIRKDVETKIKNYDYDDGESMKKVISAAKKKKDQTL